MRRVALTQRRWVDPITREVRRGLDERWGSFAAACGFVPVPLPIDTDAALEILSLCDGLILTGGDSLVEYGGSDPIRDKLELRLLRHCYESGIPIMGVCRGMQLIAVAAGASLRPIEGHVATRHRIDGDPARSTVNSYHRWSVPADLAGTTHTWDGTAEAIRTPGLAATMWHPERESPYDECDLKMYRDHFHLESTI
mgnify:CR=1 FL=1